MLIPEGVEYDPRIDNRCRAVREAAEQDIPVTQTNLYRLFEATVWERVIQGEVPIQGLSGTRILAGLRQADFKIDETHAPLFARLFRFRHPRSGAAVMRTVPRHGVYSPRKSYGRRRRAA